MSCQLTRHIWQIQHENLAVVCYINSTAEIKSWSDVSVTSANAVNIVRNLPNENILFIPDKNLGSFVKAQVPEKNVMLVKGYCPIHEVISEKEICVLKEAHPEAEVAVHPECNEAVNAVADYIGSTAGILNYVSQSDKKEWIIGYCIHRFITFRMNGNFCFRMCFLQHTDRKSVV